MGAAFAPTRFLQGGTLARTKLFRPVMCCSYVSNLACTPLACEIPRPFEPVEDMDKDTGNRICEKVKQVSQMNRRQARKSRESHSPQFNGNGLVWGKGALGARQAFFFVPALYTFELESNTCS